MRAQININRGGVLSAPLKIGMTFPSMSQTRGFVRLGTSITNAALISGSISAQPYTFMWNGDSASGSILISMGISIATLSTVAIFEGAFVVSATGTIQLQIGASATAPGHVVLRGSYIRVMRLN